MALPQGTLLKDRYKIESQLGLGGMGAVYLAYDTVLDTQVAVKMNQSPGPDSTRQFLREASLLATLRHPNLPRVTHHFVIEDVQYLVMDYIPGDNLSKRLRQQGAAPVDQVLNWAGQLGAALTYLHTQEPPVIHRDIKPANLKLTPQGQLVLVDFGIAKASDPTAATTTGARGYTPGYAPPEQYGSASTGPYSDQYAFAATFYALLTGQSPADSVERMLNQAQLTDPRELNPQIPAHVDAALRRALAVQPEERFATVKDFVDALNDPTYADTAQAARTARARREKTQKPKARFSALPVLAILGGLALVVVVLGVGGVFLINNLNLASTPTTALGLVFTEAAPPSLTPIQTTAAVIVNDNPTATFTPTLTITLTSTATLEPTPAYGQGLIAFVSDRADERNLNIFTMRMDGSDLTQLTFGEGDKTQPAWSPDGSQLVYTAHGGTLFGSDLGLDIWVMDADGGNKINLTESIGDDYDPAWSPDGQTIAFTSERVNGIRQIFFMNPDGSSPRNITMGYAAEYSPSFSPSMDWLVYGVSIRSSPTYMWLRTGSGGDVRPILTRDPYWETTELLEIFEPVFSPDSTQIAFTGYKNDGNRIYVVTFDPEVGRVMDILDIFELTTIGNKEPAWSPNGLWIIFTSSRDQNFELYLMTSNGLSQTRITDNPAVDMQPAWQPTP